MRRFFRDPLWLFLLFGGLLFALTAWQEDERRIEVTQGDVDRIVAQWQQQMRRAPTSAERTGLINQFIRDEAFYQEALALNLDVGDTIVRRRLVQKLAFLTEDLVDTQSPEPAALEAFYKANQSKYQTPERLSFRHIYFSADRSADSPGQQAEALARKAMENSGMAGDPFMLQKQYTQRSEREIGDLFGRSFAIKLASLPVQEPWQGPLRSAFGWHAIQLLDRLPASNLPFERVREKVVLDWKQQQRKAANQAYLEDLLASYTITLPISESSPEVP